MRRFIGTREERTTDERKEMSPAALARYVLLPEKANGIRPPSAGAGALKALFWMVVAVLLGLGLGRLG